MATWWLRAHGYRILARNAHVGRVEIDLIARDPRRGTLVVVEVKSAAAGRGDPVLRVGGRQRARLERAARTLLRSRRWQRVTGPGRALRFDVVGVTWRRRRWPKVVHVRSAWEPAV